MKSWNPPEIAGRTGQVKLIALLFKNGSADTLSRYPFDRKTDLGYWFLG
jgi:hypothetical protein